MKVGDRVRYTKQAVMNITDNPYTDLDTMRGTVQFINEQTNKVHVAWSRYYTGIVDLNDLSPIPAPEAKPI